MRIHLIRHTTPAIEKGFCYGQTDLDLADSFEQEKDSVLSKTLDNYDALYYSPLQRCARLAEHIKADCREMNTDILEYDFGDWEMKSWRELDSEYARSWMDDFVNIKAPNGESVLDMQARVQCFIGLLLEQDYNTVAVVTHSGVQRLFYSWVMGIPLKNMFKLDLDFGAVLEVNHHKESGNSKVKHL